MITAPQLRAVRGLLNWSRKELSVACGISVETIKNIEHEVFTPTETTCSKIRKVMGELGIYIAQMDGIHILLLLEGDCSK